jgi:hypothetical protein
VRTLAIDNGILYVGGNFSAIGGQPRGRLASFDIATGNLTNWFLGAAIDNQINTLQVSNNNVYIGGNFQMIGPDASNGVTLDINTAQIINPSIAKPNGIVFSSIPDGAGGWYIAGRFTEVGGQTRNRLARINADGSLHPWNPGANNDVRSLVLHNDVLYVGGNFTNIGGQTRNRLASFDASTGTITAWNPDASNLVRTIVVNGTTLYVGGTFISIGGQIRNGLAALDISTGVPTGWSPSPSDEGNGVIAIGIKENIVYVGGAFYNMGGQPRMGFAARCR